jgi:hypothetical protein
MLLQFVLKIVLILQLVTSTLMHQSTMALASTLTDVLILQLVTTTPMPFVTMVLVLTRVVSMQALVTSTQLLAATTDHASSSSTALEHVVAHSSKMRVETVLIPTHLNLETHNSISQAANKPSWYLMVSPN